MNIFVLASFLLFVGIGIWEESALFLVCVLDEMIVMTSRWSGIFGWGRLGEMRWYLPGRRDNCIERIRYIETSALFVIVWDVNEVKNLEGRRSRLLSGSSTLNVLRGFRGLDAPLCNNLFKRLNLLLVLYLLLPVRFSHKLPDQRR
jgi:hypothetical protein